MRKDNGWQAGWKKEKSEYTREEEVPDEGERKEELKKKLGSIKENVEGLDERKEGKGW